MKEFKDKTIKELKEMYPDATESRLYYMKDLSQRKTDKPYKPRPRRGITETELILNNVEIHEDPYSDSGYIVLQNNIKRPIYLRKTGQYKYGGQKYHYYTYFNSKKEDGKTEQRPIALASVISCLIKHEDVPAGYVVDHIDNDSFNNNIDNLQVITTRDNVLKNPPKEYYWKKK